jgi:hypothetical protein
MPDEIRYDASATPPQFTNDADIVIEQGTHVRVKIIGMRTEVGEMWAIGSINGDFLGYVQRATDHIASLMLTVLLLQLSATMRSFYTAAVCWSLKAGGDLSAPRLVGEGWLRDMMRYTRTGASGLYRILHVMISTYEHAPFWQRTVDRGCRCPLMIIPGPRTLLVQRK